MHDMLDAIADWCDRYTPLVGLDPPDGLFLDITGCAHLFGGEARLCRDLMRRLAAQGFRTLRCRCRYARLCVGGGTLRCSNLRSFPRKRESSVFLQDQCARLWVPAGACARAARPGYGDERSACASPARSLAHRSGYRRTSGAGRTENHRPDFSTCRARRSPRAFGEGFVRRIDQALGIEDEPIVPRLPVPSFLAEQRFAEPIGREEDVLGTIVHLARELARAMERHGKGARRLQTALFRTDGKVARIEIGTSAPLRDPERIRRLFRRSACGARRRGRSGLRLRHDPAVGACGGAARSGADRA